MHTQPLSEREEQILQAVVHSYITSAEPVGSRAVVKRFNLSISPATVRNVMADLEDAGYLAQLHTSSGRVPTDAGYRYYVDYLMRVQKMTLAERNRLEGELQRRLDDADAVLREASHLLALISHHTGIVEVPNSREAEVKRIEVLPIAQQRVVVLLADNYGRVRTMVMGVDKPLTSDEAMKLTRFLNEHVTGVAIDHVGAAIESKLRGFVDEQRRLAEQAAQVLQVLPMDRPSELFLEGQTQLFEQPEFRNVETAREVFGLLEERERVMELLRANIATDKPRYFRVVIGSEASEHGVKEVSVVSAPYKIGDRTVGMVGILGPRRMPYSRLTGVVEYTANMLGRMLTRLSS